MSRRRDRHGRGARVGSRPWHGLVHFEAEVHAAIASLEPNWPVLGDAQISIIDIPDLDRLDAADSMSMRLAELTPGPTITVFRHPITIRCNDSAELKALILDVLIEQLAEIVGLDPEEIDDRYGESG